MKKRQRPLSRSEFEKSFKYGPKTAYVLMIFNDQDQILLSRRAIEPCNGSWHIPGSTLDKGETVESCLERVAEEIGMPLNPTRLRFLGVYNNSDGDPRGHVVDHVFGVRFNSKQRLKKPGKEAVEVSFFDPENLPRNVGFGHGRTIQKVCQTIQTTGGRFKETTFPLFKDFFHELR